MRSTFSFNGHSSDEFGIYIVKKPNIDRSARKFRSASVDGRNGNIYQLQDAWNEVIVSYDIYAGGMEDEQVITDFTDIMEWLNSADDYAVLTDSYDTAHYRLAVYVDSATIEQAWYSLGKTTISFRCRPQRYLSTGANIMQNPTAGTYSDNGITAVVNSRGIVTVSGTATADANVIIPLDKPFTITQSMIDDGLKAYLKSSKINGTLHIRDSNNNSLVGMGLETTHSWTFPANSVGKTISSLRIYTLNTYTLDGTFSLEIRTDSSTITVADGDTIINPTNHTAEPIITLTESGPRSRLNLEKSYSSMNISDDRFYGNLITYMGFINLGTSARNQINVTLCTDAYATGKGASITTHSNSTGTLTFTPAPGANDPYGVGTALKLTPNNDYTISCTVTSGDSKIYVGFYSNSSGFIESVAEKTTDQAGDLVLTFHTPEDCENVLIIFFRPGRTAGTFSSIMLTAGTSARTFDAYSSLDPETITFALNNTTLSMQTYGFDEAVIDCERENFSVDGVDSNAGTSVLDQYGNVSIDYLQLNKGENPVTFTGSIVSVSMETRMWEL